MPEGVLVLERAAVIEPIREEGPSFDRVPRVVVVSGDLHTALAIKEFGFAKGFVLFIWRLMRCNPAGGKGYDSPAWPPVGFKAGDALPAPRGRMPSLVEEDVD